VQIILRICCFILTDLRGEYTLHNLSKCFVPAELLNALIFFSGRWGHLRVMCMS
jgi:hypothetical protein